MRMKNVFMIIAALMLMLSVSTTATALESGKTWWAGAKLGINLPGEITMDFEPPEVTASVDPGLMFAAFIDSLVGEKLAVGGVTKLGFPSVGGDGVTFFAVGPTIKAIFEANERLTIRPGIAFLYQLMSGANGGDGSSGLGLELFVEGSVPINETMNFVGEIGFNGQPTGGNDAATITWSPMFFLMAGIEF